MTPKLTPVDWKRVFDLRCRARRGESLSQEAHKLLTVAWRQDPDRYSALGLEAFEATTPFGSRGML